MKKNYLLWNLTNYGAGYEIVGAYTSKDKAQEAFKREMLGRYGTIDEDRLIELWNDSERGRTDSWRITTVEIKK